MLIHPDPRRMWVRSVLGVLIGLPLALLARWGRWESLFAVAILAGIGATVSVLVRPSTQYDLLIDRGTLRAPVRRGFRLVSTEISMREIDLSQSRIRRFRPSVLKLRDGRQVFLPQDTYRLQDIRDLFEELGRLTSA